MTAPDTTLPALAADPRVDRSRDTAVAVGQSGLQMTTLDDMFRFAQYIEKSAMCPQGMKAPDIVVALQTGAELGFSPIRSLTACPVVKGRPSIAGEAALALIRKSGTLDPRGDIEVWSEGQDNEMIGFCKAWRRGWTTPREVTFSYADAKKAALTARGDMYSKYREDMLIWRAVSRMAKRNFSDVTLGLELGEVARDLPPIERDVTPPAGQQGGQGPDPLLASVIAPGEALTPEVLPAEPEPEPQREPAPAVPDADLSEYSEPEPVAAPVIDPITVGDPADLAQLRAWKPPAACGRHDSTGELLCMHPYDHDGPCDWDEPGLPLG